MRDVEFRAWNSIEEDYLREISIARNVACFGVFNGYYGKDTESCIIEQYTGIKDCTKWEELTTSDKNDWLINNKKEDWNGKKIFEGDIAEHIPKFEVNYFVKYLTSGFYLCPNNENHGENFCSLFAGYNEKTQICEKIKIIGNIHENKELLGVTK